MNECARHAGRIRLLPVLVVALAALGTVKGLSIVLVGSYSLIPFAPATAQEAPGKLRESKAIAPNLPDPVIEPGRDIVVERERRIELAEPGTQISEAERSLLESLKQRREEIEEREREIGMREQLLKAAEKRIDDKIAELKEIEARVAAGFKAKEEEDEQQFANLVKMYESMKPKNAARIFDTLDLEVLVGVARRMKPAALANVVAAMDPLAAKRVTSELVNASREQETSVIGELAPIMRQ